MVADPLTEYLHNLSYYEVKYTAHGAQKRFCVPDGLHMSKNLMSFNLGFPTGFPPGSPDLTHDSQAVDDWLEELEWDFLLILIVEHIDESLVLLKRLMYWTLQDILYKKRNSGKYTKEETVNTDNYEIYRNWSNVDFRLYNHFTEVFWSKVYAQGPDFMEEVAHFKKTNSLIMGFCGSGNKTLSSLTVEESKWNDRFTYTLRDCDLYSKPLTDEIKERYNVQYANLIQPIPKVPTC